MSPTTKLASLAVALIVSATAVLADAAQPQALVYRGPSACKGCPEAVAKLLQGSSSKFVVTYVGPKENTDISADTLSKVDVFAMPGGPDLNTAYSELKSHQTELRNFVQNGGRYMGFCLGAFLAGSNPGFGLLPSGATATSEILSPNAQVKNSKDTIIQVDWTFRTTATTFDKGSTASGQWVYFQEGAVINGLDDNSTVLGRYSQNGNVAASLTPLGKGWVALTGPHPEATTDWYRAYRLDNPDGVKFDIGYDFVDAAMQASALPSGTTGPKPTSSQESGWTSMGRGRGRMTLQNPIGMVVQSLKSLW